MKKLMKFTLGAMVCLTFFLCGTGAARNKCEETSEPAKVAAATPPKPATKPVPYSCPELSVRFSKRPGICNDIPECFASQLARCEEIGSMEYLEGMNRSAELVRKRAWQ